MKGIQYDYLRVSVLYFNPIFVFVLFFFVVLFVCLWYNFCMGFFEVICFEDYVV